MSIRRRAVGLVLPLLAAICVPVRAGGPASRPSVPDCFMRFLDDGHGGGSLQTAELVFVNGAGVRVHLVAAIHIGEKSYYDGLNQDFQADDAVLYEMVKPKDAPPPSPAEGDDSGDTTRPQSDVSKFQRLLKDSLQLDFQLDDIDYTAPNFIHADLDSETFEKMQAQRGESFETLMLSQLMNALNQQPKDGVDGDAQSMSDLVHILTRPDMERQIKVVIARQLGQMDSAAMGLDGPQGSVILTERNKAAMAALENALGSGKKNVAIFFGAAHMPDLSKRLEALGFEPESIQWRLAWDLKIRADQPSAVELLMNKMFGPGDQKQ
jgi:hypothetical protein